MAKTRLRKQKHKYRYTMLTKEDYNNIVIQQINS